MRASEKRLLAVAGVLVLVMGVLFLWQAMSRWQRSLERRERDAELAQMEADALLGDKLEWQARETWLDQTMSAPSGPLEATQELNHAEETARQAGLEPLKKQLLEPLENAFCQQVGFAVTVKGGLPEVFRWMHQMQSPSAFRVVPSLKITPDKEDPAQVVASVQFWRWYLLSEPKGAL